MNQEKKNRFHEWDNANLDGLYSTYIKEKSRKERKKNVILKLCQYVQMSSI